MRTILNMDSFFALDIYQASQTGVHKAPLESTAAKLPITNGKNTPFVCEIAVAITTRNGLLAYGRWMEGIFKDWSMQPLMVFRVGEKDNSVIK